MEERLPDQVGRGVSGEILPSLPRKSPPRTSAIESNESNANILK